MPDVQFFTYESNVLYLRSDKNLALRGMLVFATYPLILDNQWFTADADQKQRFAFSSDGVQGTYNATLMQLGYEKARPRLPANPEIPGGQRSAAGRQRASRFHLLQTRLRPPVWLSTVGNKTFLPLRIDYGFRIPATLLASCKVPAQCPAVPKKYPSLNLPFLPLAAIMLAGFALFVLASATSGSISSADRMPERVASWEYDLRPIRTAGRRFSASA